MAKSRILWIVLIVVVLIGLWLTRIYNSLVTADENVSTAWSQVENVYQRRLDLIPNLVSTVQGAADFERNTLNEVIQARAAASSINLDAGNLNEANLAAFQQAQDGLGQALSRLMVVIERYPDLKANQNFRDLQSQLEGTENRIAVERNRFNEAVRIYNTSIRRFPKNVIAGMFGFEARAYFQADENAHQAPQVQF